MRLIVLYMCALYGDRETNQYTTKHISMCRKNRQAGAMPTTCTRVVFISFVRSSSWYLQTPPKYAPNRILYTYTHCSLNTRKRPPTAFYTLVGCSTVCLEPLILRALLCGGCTMLMVLRPDVLLCCADGCGQLDQRDLGLARYIWLLIL